MLHANTYVFEMLSGSYVRVNSRQSMCSRNSAEGTATPSGENVKLHRRVLFIFFFTFIIATVSLFHPFRSENSLLAHFVQ